jgi:transglutaminase-like putative cysteine protease
MIYDVRQVTTYDYGSPVPYSRHVARQLPVDRPGQRVIAATLDITPRPAEISQTTDFFGNRTTLFALDEPHKTLVVALRAQVAVEPPEPELAGLSPTVERVVAMATASADLGLRSPVHHLFPSRSVPLTPEIAGYAAASFAKGRPIVEAALDLTRRIKADFTYEPGATDVTTPPAVAFQARRGVCQDFAHVMIAGLRGLGLPAGYISGYLRTLPPPGKPRLEGADATHAWVAVWCGPERGFVGFDPTNGVMASEDHIVAAFGRDFADVSPLAGVIVVAGNHTLDVKVDVVPVGTRKA